MTSLFCVLIFFFGLFPSGGTTADHLPPSSPIPCLICFYTNHLHVLFHNIHKSSPGSFLTSPLTPSCQSPSPLKLSFLRLVLVPHYTRQHPLTLNSLQCSSSFRFLSTNLHICLYFLSPPCFHHYLTHNHPVLHFSKAPLYNLGPLSYATSCIYSM